MADEGRQAGDTPQRESGISSVAAASGQKRAAAVLLFVAGLVGLGAVVLFTGGEKAPKKAPEAEGVFVPTPAGEAPELPSLPPPERPQVTTPGGPQARFRPPVVPAPPAPPALTPAEQEALARANARRRSPMLIGNAAGSAEPRAGAKQVDSPLAEQAAALRDRLEQLRAQQAAGISPGGGALAPSFGAAPSAATASQQAAQTNQAFANAAPSNVPVSQARVLDDMGYRINQGKMIRAVLESAIQSDLPGLVRAVVTEDVYSADGERVLIVRGSRLVGEYASGLVRGQSRVFVIWNRVIQPDGTDIQIGSRGTDPLGRAGLTGEIDRHFVQRFGAAFLLSLIGSGVVLAQENSTVVLNTSESFQDTAESALEQSANIPPTVHIDQGTPIQVFVARDLLFSRAWAAKR